MNLYITSDDILKLKKAFLNLRKQHIIVVEDIIRDLGYEVGNVDEYASFIVNQKIKKIISNTSLGKKTQSIIYVNPSLNDEVIREIIHFCQDHTPLGSVILLTEKGQNEIYYELFEEILFYPAIKKVHIIECVPVSVAWLDDSFNEHI
jgi:hypothetical protein